MCVLASALLPVGVSAAAKPRFEAAPRLDISGKRLFDIGVADPDRDGRQDIFTTNHKFKSVFLRNLGGGSFRNEIDEIGLGPDPQFPGLDLLRPPADESAPGIYIWPSDEPGEAGQLHVEATGMTVTGRLSLMTRRVNIRSSSDAEVVTGVHADNRPLVDFTLQPGGEFVVASNGLADLPIEFEFPTAGADAITPGEIKVGALAVSPSSSHFQFKLRDRHGVAFADVGGDRDQDVFVTTGGLGGGIASKKFFGFVADQLLISAAAAYVDQIFVSGMTKGRCRGRSASYADPDGGGLLDLLVTCEDSIPKLFAQTLRGGFVEVEAPPVIGSVYRWAQLGRGRPSLLVSTHRGLEVWRSRHGAWHRTDTIRSGAEADQIAVGDFDNSGTLDVLVSGGRGLALLANRHGHLRPVRSRLGLPSRVAAATFVDFDNDGRLDVDVAPQGLYRWDGGRGRWKPTGAMRLQRTGYAIVEWMDYDNDGRRDPLIATSKREFSPGSHIIRKRNTTRAGHWLEVDLTGGANNREAFGARVTVEAGRRTITQWIGQNDDSRHSQGQYRLYFGLGRERKVRRLVVHWPGGSPTKMRGVRADRLLDISRHR